MVNKLPLNSTTPPTKFLMVDASNAYRGAAGLSPLPAIKLSKDCGEFVDALGEVVEIGYGWYELLGHAQDRDTPGELTIHGIVADGNIRCVDPTYLVVLTSPSPPDDDDGFGATDSQNLTNLSANIKLLSYWLIPPSERGNLK